MADSQDSLGAAQHFILVTQIYFCAMYAVVLWDWLISLPREWTFIWKTHWTPVKVAYLFCRYWVITVVPYLLYCFVVDHSLETCERIFRIPVALAMWNQVASESILLIRTYAFFNRNNYILAFLICAILGVVAYQLYVDTSQMLLLPFVKPPFDSGPCFPMSKPHSAHLLGFFIAPLLFDTLVTFMTIWKAFRIRCNRGVLTSRLIQTFIREGVFYYILISIANLINGIFYLQPRQVISAINIPLSVMMGPVLACRLVLDLRERGSETVSHSEGIGAPAFASKPHSGSPFSESHPHHSKIMTSSRRGMNATTGTISSNLILSTIHDADEQDLVEMGRMGYGRYSKEDSKPSDLDGEDTRCENTPQPAYLEMGFKAAARTSFERGDIRGIRVDVEKTTTTM